MVRVCRILESHAGRTPVLIYVESTDESDASVRREFCLTQPRSVKCTNALLTELQEVVGEEHVRFNGEPPKKSGRGLETRRRAAVMG
jgi:hypothetical protein